MKSSTLVATLAFIVLKTTAHYMFPHLIVNKTITPKWKYVRDVAPDITFASNDDDFGKMAPQYDIHSFNITCGRSAFLSAAKTQTIDVIAGEEMGFRVADVPNSGREYSSEIFHEGPAQIYLAKAHSELRELSGVGKEADWFKIASITAASDTEWATYRQNSVNFTIPAATPPGTYLLRIEQFMPTSDFNYTQWYVNCAHVNIIGSGGGSLEGYEYAKFPGTYDIMDPGLWVSSDISGKTGLLKYVAPGPSIWKG